MTQEETKHNLQKIAFDVSVAIEQAIKDMKFKMKKSTVEADLQEAKSSAKKLIEKIDEYSETLKPKFKVGDYVTDTSGDDPFICKIEEFVGNDISGKWYCVSKNYFDRLVRLPISDSRLSTKEEIAEYEVAFNFHKHGRKPFELKKGDLIRTPSEKITFILNPENYAKTDFLVYGWELLKTAEEVNEWVGVSDE